MVDNGVDKSETKSAKLDISRSNPSLPRQDSQESKVSLAKSFTKVINEIIEEPTPAQATSG